VRGVFANADAYSFGPVRPDSSSPGSAHKAILVSDRAIDTDQGQKVVYVVNKENVVDKRPVQLVGCTMVCAKSCRA